MASPYDCLQPPPTLLVKLGSLIVHLEEHASPRGHEFDRQAAASLQNDPDVQRWFLEMDRLSLLPVKRG